ncbi:hypothetical protein SSS_10453 [Sarcoptes scabiei]|nr:hypothetical protein SSS_10453 [Sarcoptes scabiei]
MIKSKSSRIKNYSIGLKIKSERGCPIFPEKIQNEITPNQKSFYCSGCEKSMIFILQIYCPIHQSDNDRILYLFSCLNPQCNDRKNILLRVVHNSNGLKQSNKLFEDEWS